jgi:hypothetical protein
MQLGSGSVVAKAAAAPSGQGGQGSGGLGGIDGAKAAELAASRLLEEVEADGEGGGKKSKSRKKKERRAKAKLARKCVVCLVSCVGGGVECANLYTLSFGLSHLHTSPTHSQCTNRP